MAASIGTGSRFGDGSPCSLTERPGSEVLQRRKSAAAIHAYLAQFLLETRRAEWAHWCMLGCLPIFFLWNPPWACLVMTAYALAANLPCILAQRYNRIVLDRVVRTRRRALTCL